MTIEDLSPKTSPIRPRPVVTEVATADALRELIFGAHTELQLRVRDIVVALADLPRSGFTYAEQTESAPELLRAVIAELGLPAREIAGDTQLRGALCDWAQIAAPRLLLILTGHFDLAIGAILALGNGSDYQRQCLDELDTAAALGVLMLTELGGTNGADQQTTATFDPETGGFRLTTPCAAAVKFMPNVADPHVPKTAVVTARLLIDGRDEGVLPFLLRLRTAAGVTDGVDIVRLPDKSSAPMDHAMVRFDNVALPRDALLGGDWARFDADGTFRCALPARHRFHAAVAVLGNGRLDLANAAIASARAALAGLVNYAYQRRPGSGTLMADRDAVQSQAVSALAEVYAASVLGRRIRELRTGTAPSDPVSGLWSMLAKPLLSDTAERVLTVCRRRTAAQGALRVNHLLDWIGNLEAIITAEGENQILQVTAGKRGHDLTALAFPGTPERLPWYIELLAVRERAIADDVHNGTFRASGVAAGPDSAAIALATATAERLAATALFAEANQSTDPTAMKLATAAAAAYALAIVQRHAAWYIAHHHLAGTRLTLVVAELHRHQATLIAHLPTMVAAFATPVLPGPIFSPDYIRAWQDHADWQDGTFPRS
ncbi:acyl-CoA dehydrogenase family protein [Nocardia yamanashiensis]|uniref:acyl-CoA dehydrogenase family protein n=1 Tax=Nocardia yamanashiensis TaxID=209247 RepID=UPI000831FE83|nr:acyl-CoA dehydrogenase family protein [Nocardia yamanashiensis]